MIAKIKKLLIIAACILVVGSILFLAYMFDELEKMEGQPTSHPLDWTKTVNIPISKENYLEEMKEICLEYTDEAELRYCSYRFDNQGKCESVETAFLCPAEGEQPNYVLHIRMEMDEGAANSIFAYYYDDALTGTTMNDSEVKLREASLHRTVLELSETHPFDFVRVDLYKESASFYAHEYLDEYYGRYHSSQVIWAADYTINSLGELEEKEFRE